MDVLKSLPLPTLDRPFGIQLWPICEAAWTKVLGYSPMDFEFVQGVTPISTFKETAAIIITYYVVIFGGREFMRAHAPVKWQLLFQFHNLFLTLLSGTLLALFVEQLLPTLVRRGVYYGICSRGGGWTQPMLVLYYLNYLTKYFELLDTVFLVIKKKPLTFLHTYHHGATALLCYTQLVGSTPVSWVPITLNLLVHVVMYWYYFQSSRGIRVWWKQWITRLQIAQFVIDLFFIYFASYNFFADSYNLTSFKWGSCAGEDFAAIAGCVILSSYLVLFIGFYLATYKMGGRSAAKKAVANGDIAICPKVPQDAFDNLSNGKVNGIHANGYANGYSNGNANVKENGSVRKSRKG